MRTILSGPAALLLALPARAGGLPETDILAAEYSQPTSRYAHGILGDALEWGALTLTIDTCRPARASRCIASRSPCHKPMSSKTCSRAWPI